MYPKFHCLPQKVKMQSGISVARYTTLCLNQHLKPGKGRHDDWDGYNDWDGMMTGADVMTGFSG